MLVVLGTAEKISMKIITAFILLASVIILMFNFKKRKGR